MIINLSIINFLKIFFIIYTAITGWISPTVAFFFDNTNYLKAQTYSKQNLLKIDLTSPNTSIAINIVLKSEILLSIPNFIKNHYNNCCVIKKNKKTANNDNHLIYIKLHANNQYDNIYIPYTNTILKNFYYYIQNYKSLKIDNQLKNLFKYKNNKTQFIKYPLQLLQQQYIITQYKIYHLAQQKIKIINTMIIIKNIPRYFFFSQFKKNNKIFKKINKSKYMQLNNNYYATVLQSYITTPLTPKKHYYPNNDFQNAHKIAIAANKKKSSKNNQLIPKAIQHQININDTLAKKLTKQTYSINSIISQQKKVTIHILQTQNILNKLIEQTQWLSQSSVLKEILRSQISKLPNTPNFQKIDNNITQLQKKRFQYEHQIKQLPLILSKSTQDNGNPLTLLQKYLLEQQIIIQHNLIISLLNSYDTQILELTKLKFSCETLKDALQKIQKAMYRYLFWVADIHPINTSDLLDIYQDFQKLITEKRFKQQIKSTIYTICYNKKILALMISSIIISIGLYTLTNQSYQKFLEHSNKRIGKINQDNFSITFYSIWYSMIIALPIPIFCFTIGYIFSHLWAYPLIISIGNSINYTTFILWMSITSSYFASSKGLFIVHFGWSKKKIQQIFSPYYTLSISVIVFLIMALIVFNNYNEKEFYTTLGRLCFILICIHLSYITNNLKKSKLPLYINKYDSTYNRINSFLWNIMICIPIIASIACAFGYFFVAQKLLIRLEASLFIWIILLIIYYLVKRWMSIQRNRIAFKHAQQKRAKKLDFRTHKKINLFQNQNSVINNKLEFNKNNKKTLDLNTINTQSLQLIRSIITLIAILLMTILWSELHPAFSFLEKITLWDVTSTIKGMNNIQPITLNSFLIAILVIIITTKTVHNVPAFLELTLLQHLHLNPGTRYAITTLTKYILMLLGSIIGCSLIGIEWSKIQWLIAALGVGLGFGLQEIFANFISGIMILFEKPIRIGDTITIQNITGNVTRINTRATTITDWDHKEIIIPNKEFITKQFTNWSLSDTTTRVVLKVPGPTHINVKKTTAILLKIIKNSTLILNTPPPEVYLSDLQQGFPIFEIRMYVAHTKLRMPLRHQIHLLIVDYYQKHGIELPYLPNCIYKKSMHNY